MWLNSGSQIGGVPGRRGSYCSSGVDMSIGQRNPAGKLGDMKEEREAKGTTGGGWTGNG